MKHFKAAIAALVLIIPFSVFATNLNGWSVLKNGRYTEFAVVESVKQGNSQANLINDGGADLKALIKLNADNRYDAQVQHGQQRALSFKRTPLTFTIPLKEADLLTKDSAQLTFKLAMQPYSKSRVIDQITDCQQYQGVEAQQLCQLRSAATTVSVYNFSAATQFIKQFSVEDSQIERLVNIYQGDKVLSVQYNSSEFFNFINSWQQVEIIGYIEDDVTRYLLIRPYDKNKNPYPLQAMSFIYQNDEQAPRLIYGHNWDDVYLYFYNSLFINALDKALRG
ncbi:hypothetical protein [Thalassotalea ganghwensis]